MSGPVRSATCMVATAHPAASEVALSVLRQGGHAVDAAVAAQAVLGVVEPQASGLGGGGLLLVWTGGDRKLVFIEGLARAPADVPEDWLAGRDVALLQRSGLVVGVPGVVRTLALAHRRYGRLSWDALFADAIRIAEDGFPLPRYLHACLRQRPELARKPPFAGAYFQPDGSPRPVGTILRNPDLATTLRMVAADPEAFYRAPFATMLARAVAEDANPGAMRESDLAAYPPVERAPVAITAFGHRIVSAAPPVSGGVTLLQQLATLERLGIADAAPGSAEAAHLMLEAGRLTREDRRRWLGDPDQVAVPTAGLLDPAYLDARAALVDRDRASAVFSAGTPPGTDAASVASDPVAHTATSHLSIIDAGGNAVAFTTTINQLFGSDIVAGGLVLNDALTNFAEQPVRQGRRVLNAIAPNKRPITTMAPTIVFGADDRPLLVLGAGGGARIIDAVAQTILGVLAWGQDVRSAVEAPRFGAQNGPIELEQGTAAASLAPALLRLGHAPEIVEMNAAVQAVMRDRPGLAAWADPRRDGAARGD